MATLERLAPPSTDDFIRYELGEMSDEEAVEFFQRIIDNHLFRALQGSYGRMCLALIREGLCVDTYGDFGYNT